MKRYENMLIWTLKNRSYLHWWTLFEFQICLLCLIQNGQPTGYKKKQPIIFLIGSNLKMSKVWRQQKYFRSQVKHLLCISKLSQLRPRTHRHYFSMAISINNLLLKDGEKDLVQQFLSLKMGNCMDEVWRMMDMQSTQQFLLSKHARTITFHMEISRLFLKDVKRAGQETCNFTWRCSKKE